MKDLDTKKHSSSQTQRQVYSTKLYTEGTHTRSLRILQRDTPLHRYAGGHANVLQYTRGHPHTNARTHTYALSHWLGHLAGSVCVWRRRENSEKGKSEEREVGQRLRQFQVCPGPWLAVGINPSTTWLPASACLISSHSRPLCLFSCFLHQVYLPHPVVSVIVSCLS